MVSVKQDLTDMVFGRLTVVQQVEDYIYPNGKYREAQYECICSCQDHNTVVVRASMLKNHNTMSCGCLQKDRASIANKKNNKNGLCEDNCSKWIVLTNTEELTYYDLENAEQIEKHTWRKDGQGYAVTSIDGHNIRMHQLIGFNNYDHQNKNKLDNRKSNLRSATSQQNAQNRPLYKNNTSGVTGVSWDKATNQWHARIGLKENNISITKHLGRYTSFDDAVYARLQAEVKYFGEFAPQKHLFEQYKISQYKELEGVNVNELC